MDSRSLRRPIGFAPSEISVLVNEAVVSQHAEEAAFLWMLRNRAVSEPHYSLNDLVVLDGRVEAQLDGLRIAKEVGWRFCKANLAQLGPGEVFALSAVAFGSGDRDRMREALLAGCSDPHAVAGLVSALGWLDFRVASPWIDRLLQAASSAHRVIGLRASAIHRRDPGVALTSAVSDPDPALCASALRAVGELKRHDLIERVRVQLKSLDDKCRFWAAWSLALTGWRDGQLELLHWFEQTDAFGRRALQLGLRSMDLEESREHVSALARKPETATSAVIGAGIVGDPASVPWLIRQMESKELARLAGEAFTMITGVDLAFHDLDQDSPEDEGDEVAGIEEVLDLDYESNLPWPSPQSVYAWWQGNHRAFASGRRYLAGQPISQTAAVEVLKKGKQRLRAAAALELALLDKDLQLFEVRARGTVQHQELTAWNS